MTCPTTINRRTPARHTAVCVMAVLLAVAIATLPCTAAPVSPRYAIGASLIAPTGIDFRVQGKRDAMEFAAGWNINGSRYYIHGDYLMQYFRISSDKEFSGRFYWYHGPGLYLAGDNATLALGFRYVLGMEYLFRGAPIELYFNIAPALQLAPSTAFGIFPALGVRFTFQ